MAKFATAQSPPEENPFGLPEPLDPKRPGAVMLLGGGAALSDDLRLEFVRLAGGHDARIVLLPSDQSQRGLDGERHPRPGGETQAEYERRISAPAQYGCWSALGSSGLVADFQFLFDDETLDPNLDRFYALLDQATGVWLPAYDQEWLPEKYSKDYPNRTSRFQLAIRQVVARGGVVGGTGGGMACLPEVVIARSKTEEGGWTRAELRFGLALFNGAVVDQNFNINRGRLERLTDLLRNGSRLDRLASMPGVERRTIGLGIEHQTALILQGSKARAMGEGKAHIFLKNNGDRTITWQTLAPGDEPVVLRSSTKVARPAAAAPSATDPAALNPFGMPEPNDPNRPGTIVLHGGSKTDELIALFPKLTGAGKPRLVHCPAARESCRPSAECQGSAMDERLEELFARWRQLEVDGRIASLTFLTTNAPADANRETFVEPLRHADGLWFCGGDQKPLADLFVDRLAPTQFQQQVENIVRRGGAVGGSSAGLAIMPDIMIEASDPNDDSQPTLARGLGLLRNVLAEQHFDTRAGRIDRLAGTLRNHRRLANCSPTCNPARMIGLAVEEETALIVQANRLQVVGRRLAHVFLQAADPRVVVWHALKPGDAAIVRPGPTGNTLELEDWQITHE